MILRASQSIEFLKLVPELAFPHLAQACASYLVFISKPVISKSTTFSLDAVTLRRLAVL